MNEHNENEDRLDTFLRENRPQVPDAPTEELRELTARVSQPDLQRNRPRGFFYATAAATLLFCFMAVSATIALRPPGVPQETAAGADELTEFAVGLMRVVTDEEEDVFSEEPLAFLID